MIDWECKIEYVIFLNRNDRIISFLFWFNIVFTKINSPGTRTSQTLDAMSHSVSPEMVPILGNDAKTQGKPNDFVKSRHESSKKSSKSRKPHLVLKRTKVSGGPGKGLKRIPKRSELVYLQPSPNYCEPDLAQGSLGTQGRYCNRTSKGERKWW